MRKPIKSGTSNFGSNKDVYGFDFPLVTYVTENYMYDEETDSETEERDYDADDLEYRDTIDNAKDLADEMGIPQYDDYSEPYLCYEPFMIKFRDGYYEGLWIEVKEGTDETPYDENGEYQGNSNWKSFTEEQMNQYADKLNEYFNRLCNEYGWTKLGVAARFDNGETWYSKIENSRKPIKSAKSAIECFAISEEDAENVDELRETFPDDSDLRAALEDYFHIYDDYAEMSVNEFDKCFKEFISSSVQNKVTNIKSSQIGDIRYEFSMGSITDKQAELKLRMEGKSRNEAKNIVNKWKEHGIVKSSLDKAIKKAEDYFGTTASDCTVSCNDVITEHDRQQLEQIALDEGVDCQIGEFSVRFFDKEEMLLESSLIDKYIKGLGRLIKETDNGELNDDKSARLNDRLDSIFDKLVDEKDDTIMYDQTTGEYSINGEDVKRYIIETLGENFFDKNKQWDKLLDSILPNIRDFATTKQIAACYEVYKDLGKGNFEFVTSTLNKVEADSFKNNGFMVKSSKVIVSNIGVDNETVIEIYKDGRWEMVSLDNTPEGWSTNKQAKIFPSEDKARASSLLKRLQAAGYSEDNGTLKISQYNN